MTRRQLLRLSPAFSLAIWLPTQHLRSAALPNSSLDDVRISALRVHKLTKTWHGKEGAWQGSVQPLHLYPEHRPAPYRVPENPGDRDYVQTAHYLTLETDDGVRGVYGPIDAEAVPVLTGQLRSFVVGQNPLAGEILWDQLYRSNRHARGGHYMLAISAVDNACWDLRGRYFDAPVYKLLGGARTQVPVYASTLGRSVQLDEVGATARDFAEAGFTAQKWFLPYGPGDGAAGLEHNIRLAHALREAVGTGSELMYDAFSGLDLPYALRWCAAVADTHPRWLEEPFLMEQLDSYAELARRTDIPIASGEHLYNRWQTQRMLKAGAMRVVQADPEWCGGVSEMVKICTVASLYGAQVIPHGHNLHAALHVVASQSPAVCPMGEYLHDKMQGYYHFNSNPLKPVHGMVILPDTPGFGLDWDEGKADEVVEL